MADATNYLYKVNVLRVVDGDTVELEVDLGFYIAHRTKIRMAGINAPELSTDAGKAAKTALSEYILAKTGQWTAQTYKSGEDKYGRWLCTLFAPDGASVNQWLLDSGNAVVDKG